MTETGTVVELVRRTEVYIREPAHFEVSGCACGNEDTQWSEFQGHCWCRVCKIDFKPSSGGVFDGPIPVNVSAMLGLDFRMVNLETDEIFDPLERGKA